MSTVSTWLQDTRDVYFGNATATRDFRVQLRGNRAVILFSVYLAILIGTAYLVYGQAAGAQRMSIVEAQSHLHSFYIVIMELLAGAVCLIAPGLSATTVILEKQRRSLDLIFSAPVTAKYFLVGKMFSSYRFIWMLLVLSLPVTASCVVLGGASWSDVLGAYVLLSTQALVLTSLALLMSTVAPAPVSAVLWSYAICLPYLFFTAAYSAASVAGSMMSHAGSSEASFGIALCPFTVVYAVGTHTTLWGVDVPNWMISVLASGLISKMCLLSAGAILSPPSGREATSLRIHGLLLSLIIAGGFAYTYGKSSAIFAVTPFARGISAPLATDEGIRLAHAMGWLLSPLVVVIEFITCYGFYGERRYLPDGVFRISKLFKPSPATGLPFMLVLVLGMLAAGLVGYAIGAREVTAASLFPGMSYLVYAVWITSFWCFFWACGRYASAVSQNLRAARTLHFVIFVAIVVLPVSVMSVIDNDDRDQMQGVWKLWVMRPMFLDSAASNGSVLILACILGLLALSIAIASERRLAAREKRMNAQTQLAT